MYTYVVGLHLATYQPSTAPDSPYPFSSGCSPGTSHDGRAGKLHARRRRNALSEISFLWVWEKAGIMVSG